MAKPKSKSGAYYAANAEARAKKAAYDKEFNKKPEQLKNGFLVLRDLAF